MLTGIICPLTFITVRVHVLQLISILIGPSLVSYKLLGVHLNSVQILNNLFFSDLSKDEATASDPSVKESYQQ